MDNFLFLNASFWGPFFIASMISGFVCCTVILLCLFQKYKKDKQIASAPMHASAETLSMNNNYINYFDRLGVEHGFWFWFKILRWTQGKYIININHSSNDIMLHNGKNNDTPFEANKKVSSGSLPMFVYPRKNALSWMFSSKKNMETMKILYDTATVQSHNGEYLNGVLIWERNESPDFFDLTDDSPAGSYDTYSAMAVRMPDENTEGVSPNNKNMHALYKSLRWIFVVSLLYCIIGIVGYVCMGVLSGIETSELITFLCK